MMAYPAPLAAAVIGCGWAGTEISDRPRAPLPPSWLPFGHAQAIRATPGVTLTTLCDSDGQRLNRAGNALGVASRYTDHREMLRFERPEIVAVATRMPGRCQIIRDCVDAGVKGIHAEKPLGASLAECAVAVDALKAGQVAFAFGTLRRFAAAYRRARGLVNEGAIGKLRNITLEHGRDLLMWGHPHSVDLFLFFAGSLDVETVQAVCSMPDGAVRANAIDADPYVENAAFRFANGVVGIITSAPGFNTHLDGTEGRLSVLGDGSQLVLRHGNGAASLDPGLTETISFDTQVSPRAMAFQEIVEAIRGGAQTSTSPDTVAVGQRLLMAIALSAANGGCTVNPAEVLPDFTVTSRLGDRTA